MNAYSEVSLPPLFGGMLNEIVNEMSSSVEFEVLARSLRMYGKVCVGINAL